MQAYGLYTHIRANRIRSSFLLAGLFALVYVLVFAAALIYEAFAHNYALDTLLRLALTDLLRAAPFATIGAAVWVFIAWRANQAIIALVTGAQGVSRAEAPRLYNLLENLCISRGIPMPALKIIETPELNAYASGLNEAQYSVTVTRGLLDALNDDEMEAVLGHELTHIRNGDVRLMVIAGVIAGIVSFFGELLFRWFTGGPRIFWGGRRDGDSDRDSGKGSGGAFAAILIAIALILISWALSQVIKFALSRQREFLADAGAVELTKNPDAMISALMKIDGRGELPNAPSGIMEMCIDNPRSGFADLFATHPSIAARIDALVRYAGGRVPELAVQPSPPATEPEFIRPDASTSSPWGAPAPGAPDANASETGTGSAGPWGPPRGPWGSSGA
jgi:heat shock protein HtpX